MIKIYLILKKILPKGIYVYLQNKKRLRGLPSPIRDVVKTLQPDDITVDCGANVGVYSQLFAKYGCKVYSFEPDPVPFRELEEKSKRFINIIPIMAAVGTNNESGKLYLDDMYESDKLFYSEHNSLVKEKNNLGDSFINIKIIDMAEWVRNFEKIKILKVDIEGYEVKLLKHLIQSRTIEKIEFVFLETHEKRIQGLQEEIIQLKKEIKSLGIEGKFFWNWP